MSNLKTWSRLIFIHLHKVFSKAYHLIMKLFIGRYQIFFQFCIWLIKIFKITELIGVFRVTLPLKYIINQNRNLKVLRTTKTSKLIFIQSLWYISLLSKRFKNNSCTLTTGSAYRTSFCWFACTLAVMNNLRYKRY